MNIPDKFYKIATGVALTASTISLAGTVYIHSSLVAPSTRHSTSQALEDRMQSDLGYLSNVALHGFKFQDPKRGDISVLGFGGLRFVSDYEGTGTISFDSKSPESLGRLGAVIISTNGNEVTVTQENTQGLHSGNLGATNGPIWGDYETEYLRLAKAALAAARTRFSNSSEQEKSLANLVNQR